MKLGQHVYVTAVLVKENHRWERKEIEQKAGVVVGQRVKKQGIWTYESNEFGGGRSYYFQQTGTLSVVLVAFDMRRNHLVCLRDDIRTGIGDS